ncbi:MAG: transglutaminase family protein [Lachnospiraceae bacterium]|nr:transglutaminase family protein [Lachnospiraceae bacterium]
MSHRLKFHYDTFLKFNKPVREHDFVLRCVPPSFAGQEILQSKLIVEPGTDLMTQTDVYGNQLAIGRIGENHTYFHYLVEGTARIDFKKREKEICHPIFRFPSPYTRTSKEMLAFLDSLILPEDPFDIAKEIAKAVHDTMEYLPGTTNTHTKAVDAFALKKGVCQDYAHICLSLLRAKGIPSRYVTGLPEGTGASHAWVEVYVDGYWIGMDPTRRKMADETYLVIGRGRDFGDCPMERGVFHGLSDQTQTVFMEVISQQE